LNKKKWEGDVADVFKKFMDLNIIDAHKTPLAQLM
jgi:hypothetical protein